MKVTSVSLTPTSVTVEWDLVQGDVTTVSLGHKTPTARARRDVSDYKILRDDIDPTERVVTVSGDFDLSVDNVFVVFVYEGNLKQPTGESDENQGTAKAEGRQYLYAFICISLIYILLVQNQLSSLSDSNHMCKLLTIYSTSCNSQCTEAWDSNCNNRLKVS